MLAVKVVETKDHLKSAINLVNQKVRMQRLVEFQLLEFAILYEAAAFSVCFVRTSSNCPSSGSFVVHRFVMSNILIHVRELCSSN